MHETRRKFRVGTHALLPFHLQLFHLLCKLENLPKPYSMNSLINSSAHPHSPQLLLQRCQFQACRQHCVDWTRPGMQSVPRCAATYTHVSCSLPRLPNCRPLNSLHCATPQHLRTSRSELASTVCTSLAPIYRRRQFDQFLALLADQAQVGSSDSVQASATPDTSKVSAKRWLPCSP